MPAANTTNTSVPATPSQTLTLSKDVTALPDQIMYKAVTRNRACPTRTCVCGVRKLPEYLSHFTFYFLGHNVHKSDVGTTGQRNWPTKSIFSLSVQREHLLI